MGAFALARLGIMPPDFGRMTLGHFVLMCRELERRDYAEQYPLAEWKAIYLNVHRDKDSKTYAEPIDFMPGWEKTPPTDEDVARQCKAFDTAMRLAIDAAEAAKRG